MKNACGRHSQGVSIEGLDGKILKGKNHWEVHVD